MRHLARPFNKAQDMVEFNHWAGMWGMPIMPLDLLPEHGFIVPGFAAGFVYLTDSKLALIKNLVANPKTDSQERSDVIDTVISACEIKAKELGYRVVLGFTTLEPVLERVLKQGYKAAHSRYFHVGKEL